MRTFTSIRRLQLWPALGWILVLLVALLAYYPGLSGSFLFDDFVNLSALGETGPVDDMSTFWRYISSGTADPTGRPLALLSFLLDARDWPADPSPFLRTNLLIHLLNGTLLFLLLRKLGQSIDPGGIKNELSSLLGAALWLLHPLLVSTTLYVVQREAMLPATFILLGLLGYCQGRRQYVATAGKAGLAMMISSLIVCTMLAFLCKANGVLLPIFAWIIEATLFQAKTSLPIDALRRLKRFKTAFLVLPSIAILAYIASHALNWNAPPGLRPWTIGERAITEPRVLVDYLHLLVVPRSVSTGLYNDDYVLSKGLLDPVSTLPALLLVAGLVIAALHFRRRVPVWSAGILFYFAGHVLESTLIPLELYFEHRNYLPAMLIFWPIARAIAYAKRPNWLRSGAAVFLLVLFAITTHQRAQIWGKPEQLASLWASRNPSSSRAQATAAIEYVSRGRPQLAMDRLAPLWKAQPNDLQIALNYVNAACAAGQLTPETKTRILDTLRHADIGTLLVRQWLEKSLQVAVAGTCPGLDLATVEAWLAAAQTNPAINTPVAREKSMPPLLAMLALERNEPDLALAYFDRALAANIAPDTAAGQVAALASHGYYVQALKHLNYYERIKKDAAKPPKGMAYVHQKILEWQGYWPNELGLLRRKLIVEINRTDSAGED